MKKIMGILICLILITIFLLYFLLRLNLLKENLLDGLIGALIGSCITLLLIWIAWRELEGIRNTTSADFIYRLRNDFFTPEARNLFILVDLNAIKFIKKKGENDIVYFEVDEEKLKDWPDEIKKDLTAKKFYISYEVDDILLGPLEDVGLYLKRKIIEIEMTYPEFGWYVKRIYENEEIKKYVEYLRKKEGEDVYENLEFLYNKCKKFKEAKTYEKSN